MSGNLFNDPRRCIEDLALNNLQWLIWHKNPTQPTSEFKPIKLSLENWPFVALCSCGEFGKEKFLL